MPLLPLSGGLGLGLAWGWLLGLRTGPARRPLRQAPALVAATLLVGLEVWLLAGVWATAAFAAGGAVTLAAHAGWLCLVRGRSVNGAGETGRMR